jgi:PcfJ-like protein
MLANISDWVSASLRASFGAARSSGGERFVTRIFSRDMSVETVLKLSIEWHSAVAYNMTGPQCQFPPPWFPAQRIDDYDLVPIENAADLYLEGKTMHHCAGTYMQKARRGDCCFFSIQAQGERVATVAFSRGPSGPVIEQVRGPCNALVPAIEKAIRKWLRRQPANLANLPDIPDD